MQRERFHSDEPKTKIREKGISERNAIIRCIIIRIFRSANERRVSEHYSERMAGERAAGSALHYQSEGMRAFSTVFKF